MEYGLQPCIVRPQLYLASARTEVYRPILEQNGITHILQAGVELVPTHPKHFTYLQLPLYDMPEQDIVSCLPAAFDFIDSATNGGGGVLIHCQAGISRSATIMIAYCMWKERLSVDAATAVVSAARSMIWPNAGFKCQLQEFEKLHWDASKWQGWSMSHYLRMQYGEESVGFMSAMLGGAPQDRISPRRQQSGQVMAGQGAARSNDGAATTVAACYGVSDKPTGTSSSSSSSINPNTNRANADVDSCPSSPAGTGSDQTLSGRHQHPKSLHKTHTASSLAQPVAPMCRVSTSSPKATRRMSYACYGGSSSHSSSNRLRRHSTGQYALSAAASMTAVQLGIKQLSLGTHTRLPEEYALMMAG